MKGKNLRLKTKNNVRFFLHHCLLAIAVLLLLPTESHAYNFANRYGVYDVTNIDNTVNRTNGRVCAIDASVVDVAPQYDNRLRFGLVKRTVLCVKEYVTYATYSILGPISNFFARLVAIMTTLAVVIWGVQAMAGRRMAATRETFVLAIKIGLVIMFTANFAADFFDPQGTRGGLFGMVLTAMEEMIAIVLSYTQISASFTATCPATQTMPAYSSPLYVLSVWDTLDCMIETLIGGIFSPINLAAGIIGFIVASLLSGTIGFFIATIGIIIIGQLIMAVIRSVYIFISAYIALGLMILISPMVIPTILFNYTKPYFDKWLKITIGLVLQPVFMFVYLAMLLAAVDVVIFDGSRSVFRSITVTAYDRHLSPAVYTNNRAEYMTIGEWLRSPPAPAGRTNFGIYQTISESEYAVNLNYKEIPTGCITERCENAASLNSRDSGLLGVVGEETNSNINRYQSNLSQILGDKIFKGGIPLSVINWDYLVLSANAYLSDEDWERMNYAHQAYSLCRANPTSQLSLRNGLEVDCALNPDIRNYYGDYYLPYIIGVIASMAMALLTLFMFMVLLNALPYIGIGISGETLSVPGLGVGRLAMPGGNLFNNMQKRIASSFSGRQTP